MKTLDGLPAIASRKMIQKHLPIGRENASMPEGKSRECARASSTRALVIAGSIALIGLGLGLCWAHVGNVVLGSARADEEEATASLIPSTQLLAVAFGSALSGIVADAAGLTREASAVVAAATGHALFGGGAIAALAAGIVATRLVPAARRAA